MVADDDNLKHQMVQMQNQLAFQEDAVRSLDEALAQQQRELQLLRRQLEALYQRLRDNAALHEAGLTVAPADEKPPHY